MKKTTSGFTIVELLIVIIVIAILATISIVAYNGIRDRANNTTVKSDLSSAAKALELAHVELGRYPRGTASDWHIMDNFKFTKSAYSTAGANAMYCVDVAIDSYAIGARSKSGTVYMLTKNGIAEGTTMFSANDVCAAAGSSANWGDPGTSTRHGYHSTGSPPAYIDGWNSSWAWTN